MPAEERFKVRLTPGKHCGTDLQSTTKTQLSKNFNTILNHSNLVQNAYLSALSWLSGPGVCPGCSSASPRYISLIESHENMNLTLKLSRQKRLSAELPLISPS